MFGVLPLPLYLVPMIVGTKVINEYNHLINLHQLRSLNACIDKLCLIPKSQTFKDFNGNKQTVVLVPVIDAGHQNLDLNFNKI